MTELPFELN